MKVFFAPDYREGVAYQALLAEALAAQGVEVTFPEGHRRVLAALAGHRRLEGRSASPALAGEVFRGAAGRARFLAEGAVPARSLAHGAAAADCPDGARPAAAQSRRRLCCTAIFSGRTMRRGRSSSTRRRRGRRCGRLMGCNAEKLHVIPHGDLSASLPPLPSRAEARAALGIPEAERVCLMFGTVEPYKGIEPVVDWWRSGGPEATLAIAGKPFSPEYGAALTARAQGAANIRFELAWQPDEALERWLAAADCVLFHYRAIFTSGAACLARSLGIPILIPRRLDTVDLAEPHRLVFRFDGIWRRIFRRRSKRPWRRGRIGTPRRSGGRRRRGSGSRRKRRGCTGR